MQSVRFLMFMTLVAALVSNAPFGTQAAIIAPTATLTTEEVGQQNERLKERLKRSQGEVDQITADLATVESQLPTADAQLTTIAPSP